MDHIRASIEAAVGYLSEHPDEARYTDSAATARLEEGLRFRVGGPSGEELVTDMPAAVGGDGSAPSPGWFLRASVASCVGSLVVMEAARAGLTLAGLEVVVDSESDDRGILGMDPSVPAGPLRMRVAVSGEVGDGERPAFEEVVRTAVVRCPVSDAVRRAVEMTLEVRAPAG